MGRRRLPLADQVATEYLAWCERQNQSEHTIRRRRAVLRSIGNPGTATREDLEAWWDSRAGVVSDRTRANDLAVVRQFYRWCQIWEHRSDDPTIRLVRPSVGTGAPKPFTRRELDRILLHVAELPQLRRAVLLGAYAGLRRAEAANLNWADIDLDTRKAHVTGKGRKTRIVTFDARLLTELGEPHDGNVVTGLERGWEPNTLGRKVNAAIRDAGVQGTFHKLRHRYGTVAYRNTKDPKALAEQMGHASVATTMSFYAAAADDAAQAVASAAWDDD